MLSQNRKIFFTLLDNLALTFLTYQSKGGLDADYRDEDG